MAKRGKKEDYLPDFHPKDFLEHSKQGRNVKQIAKRWDVARSTIYDWALRHPEFAYTVNLGKEMCEAWYIDLGQAAMVGKAKLNGEKIEVNLGWYQWMTKNICGWAERVDKRVEDVTEKPKTVVISIAQVKEALDKIENEY